MTKVRPPRRWRNMYDACYELFSGYPLAIEVNNRSGSRVESMVLMLQDDDGPRFFRLSYESSEGRPYCSLHSWGTRDAVNIGADGTAAVPDVIVKALAHGFPLPKNNSLFGWIDRGIITTLIAFYTTGTPRPRFAPMPFANLPEPRWPYAGEPLFGRWFWDGYRAGKVIHLDGLIAGNPRTVYWVDGDTTAMLGSGCFAVARDLRSPGAPALPRGRYVYCEALRADIPVPPLGTLLADRRKIDLAPRLRSM